MSSVKTVHQVFCTCPLISSIFYHHIIHIPVSILKCVQHVDTVSYLRSLVTTRTGFNSSNPLWSAFFSFLSAFTPFTPFIDSYCRNTAHHTSPVPLYITMSSPPKLLVLRNVILCIVYCTKIVFSFFTVTLVILSNCYCSFLNASPYVNIGTLPVLLTAIMYHSSVLTVFNCRVGWAHKWQPQFSDRVKQTNCALLKSICVLYQYHIGLSVMIFVLV